MIFLHKTKAIKDVNKLNLQAKLLIPKIEYLVLFGENDIRFTLSETLTFEEESMLDELLADFIDQDPALLTPKIYNLAKAEAANKHFHNIDYKKELTQTLIPYRTIVQGEVVRVQWFKSLDENSQPQDLVINVDIEYFRDDSGFALSRKTTRTWINEDSSNNDETKVTEKYYFINPAEIIEEGVKRRKLIVSSTQIPTLDYMKEVLSSDYTDEAIVLKGRAFMDDYEHDFNKFVDNSSTITDPANADVGLKSIVVKLRDEQNPAYVEWLDKAPAALGGLTTIRQYLISEFSI